MWKRLDESISLSEKLASLSWVGLGTWTYLLAQTDTMGRFPRDSRIVKAKCMTMRYEIRPETVEEALLEIERSGLLHCYAAEDGRRYLVLHDYREYNPPGALGRVSPKYPAPPPGLCPCVDSERRSAGCKSLVIPPEEGGSDGVPSTLFLPEKSVRTPDVTSPVLSSSSSTSGDDGGVGEEEESWPPMPATSRGHLWKLFCKAKITGTASQKRQYFEAWLAQAGPERLEQIFMEKRVIGKDVFVIQRWYFNDMLKEAK